MSLMLQDEFLSEHLNLLVVMQLSCHFSFIYWKAASVIQPKNVFNTRPNRIHAVSAVQNTRFCAVLMSNRDDHTLRMCFCPAGK